MQWFYDELRPWHNYVPVAPDISDLVEKVNWLNRNDAVAEAIGHRGLALASRVSYAREMTRSVPVLSSGVSVFQRAAVRGRALWKARFRFVGR